MIRNFHLGRLARFFLLAGFFAIFTVNFVFSAKVAKADVLDQSQTFFIDSQYDIRGRTSIGATLKVVSQKAYGYVEDTYLNSINQTAKDQLTSEITTLLNEFDNRIYPLETQFFGSEPNPGVDNDPRITILFAPLAENAGGYFGNSNVYPRSLNNQSSNEREMFYLNVSSLADTRKMNTFLAHEFQHLISFNQKEKLRNVADDVWLNETRSEYAPTLLGYNDPFSGSNIDRRLQTFLYNPSDVLTEWKNISADYASIDMFGEYLVEHWSPLVFSDTLKENSVGIPSIEEGLVKEGFSDKFLDVFRNWLVANILNDTSKNLKFGYIRDGLKGFKVSADKNLINLGDDLALVVNDFFKDWQPHWYIVSNFASGNNNVLRVKFSSPSLTSFYMSYLVIKSDGSQELLGFEPNFKSDTLFIDNISGLNKVILMPIKKDKVTGFSDNEVGVNMTFAVDRVNQNLASPTPTPTPSFSPLPSVSVTPTPTTTTLPRPSDFNLKEGDFIRAQGDINIYIVNNFGYKRLVLSPKICLQYSHLGARGCFGAVKIVTPQVRDSFKTSWYFTNGETHDGLVYWLEPTGEDAASLHHINISGAEFINQGGNFNSIFLFNTLEQKSYSVGSPVTKLIL